MLYVWCLSLLQSRKTTLCFLQHADESSEGHLPKVRLCCEGKVALGFLRGEAGEEERHPRTYTSNRSDVIASTGHSHQLHPEQANKGQ